jgi:hypothetical protein
MKHGDAPDDRYAFFVNLRIIRPHASTSDNATVNPRDERGDEQDERGVADARFHGLKLRCGSSGADGA